MSSPRFVLGLLAVLALTGCSARTSVNQTWSAPVRSTPMRHLVVFAARMDQANRRTLEDALATGLGRHGVAALPSWQLFPGDPPEREEARAVVARNGFDGILVATLKDVAETQRWEPGHSTSFWSSYYGPGWRGAYGSAGTLVSDEIVTCETTLWDTRAEDQLVWAAYTKTANPSTGKDFVTSLTRAILPAMTKAGFLAE